MILKNMELFSREILTEIKPFLFRKEAIFIKGLRRVGKTSLMFLIKDFLITEKKISPQETYFFDLEDLEIRNDFNQNPQNIFSYISSSKDKKYVFIDEIQYLDHPSNFIKILTDHHQNLKIIASGSSSLDIKRKIQDSLVGRVFYFQLYPLNFFEFLNFKKLSFPEKTSPSKQKNINSLLEEYLKYGGMPSVVLEKNKKIKEALLNNYVNLYISKDIRNLTEIENISGFNKMTKILSSQIGNLLNKGEISNTLGLSYQTVNRYLNILDYTYILIFLEPFFKNIRSQLSKKNKIYFYDLGIRNALINNFNDLIYRTDSGALLENFIFLQLLSIFEKNLIYFYRNANKIEVDFIIENPSLAIEVKFKKFKSKKVFRNFDSLKDFKKFVVNLNFSQKNKSYDFIDWWSFLKLIKKIN